MKDDVQEKIRIYCEKGNMKAEKLSINIVENGYVATDGYTSVMFDKEGKASSLPMHQSYGKGSMQFIGKGYGIFMNIIIVIVFILGVIYFILN